jgi:mannose-1-phosphate guanylyltransferase
MTTTYAVIMAGGSGTRFWPLSRRELPKQLLPLWGGRTLLELTAERLAPIAPIERLFVVAGAHLAAPIREVLTALPAANLLVEPAARNTLPCVALAVAATMARDPDAVLGVFSADHFVRDPGAFTAACELGIRAAAAGRIATLGIQPTRPETGFGY